MQNASYLRRTEEVNFSGRIRTPDSTRLDVTENANSDGTELAGVQIYRFAKYFSCGN